MKTKYSVVESLGEDMLYAFIVAQEHEKSSNKEIQFLHCNFFQAGFSPSVSHFKEVMDGILFSKDCSVYFCSDGDVFIKWPGQEGLIRPRLEEAIYKEFEEVVKDVLPRGEFFAHYSFYDAVEMIKAECIKKQRKPTKNSNKLKEYFSNPSLISSLKKVIHLVSTQRVFRTKPHILIVEDQKFSQKMLLATLSDYTCYVSGSCAEALIVYMEKCPDIVLLDIDLPDLSGHNFSRLLSKIDDNAYVIMVTANNTVADIQLAKENKVRGFIPKPFQKQSILNQLEKFYKANKKRFPCQT